MSNNRQVRFYYDDRWTRWFNDDEDLSFLRNLAIDKMEVIEEMTKDEAEEYLNRLNENVKSND